MHNGQRLMCIFTLCPKLPQNYKDERLSLACAGATWKTLRSGKTVDWVWGGTEKGFEVGQVCLQHSDTPKKLEIPQTHTQTVHLKMYTVSISAGLIKKQK